MPSRGLLPGLHGLRFLAAFSVLVFHMKGVALTPPPFGLEYITNRMGHGVRLFFVLSAFSLMYSTERDTGREGWIRDFAVRRFFRIAPTFYVLIGLTYLLRLEYGGELATIRSLFLNMTFTFPLVADAVPSLVNGGWTIGAEMLFYGLFPLVLSVARSWRSALVFLLVGFFAAEASYTREAIGTVPNWVLSTGLAAQLPYFAAGVLVYRLWSHRVRALGPSIGLAVVAFLALALLRSWYASVLSQIILFGALCFWQARSPSRIFANRFAVFWGERSYGIYLSHMPIMISLVPVYERLTASLGQTGGYVVGLSLTILLTGLAAEALYRLVEKPSMLFGRRFLSAASAHSNSREQRTTQ